MWCQQLHALIGASYAAPYALGDWQVYLLRWTTLRGAPVDLRREIDTQRIAESLLDPELFCDRLSMWSGLPATRLILMADAARNLILAESPCLISSR